MQGAMSNTGNQQGNPASANGTHVYTKRRKVTMACSECRSRKTKCDGNHPVCGPCVQRGRSNHCEWDIPKAGAAGVSQDYITSLESRLRELEKDSWSRKTSTQSPTDVHVTRHTPNANHSGSAVSSNTGASKARQLSSSYSSPQRFDGASAMMGNIEDEARGRGFFGTSSAGSFMHSLSSQITQAAKDGDIPKTQEKVLLSSLMPEHTEASHKNLDYALPSRKTADHLLQVYWEQIHPICPCFHRAEAEAIFQKLWTGEDEDNSLDYCQFNVILALACQLDESIKPESREHSAQVFFLRARDALYDDFWTGGTIQSVQCFLLLGQYLQSTNDPQRCWMITGMAVRLAQSLGLHSLELVSSLRSFREQELVKKVWNTCVLMDRIVCTALGRPGMVSRINAVALPPPMELDEEQLPLDGSQPTLPEAQTPSTLSFFVYCLPLFEIMNEILVAFYHPLNREKFKTPYERLFGGPIMKGRGNLNSGVHHLHNATIFQLETSLMEWKQSLPPFLNPDSEVHRDNVRLRRQAIVLNARYLQIRMLLFRPVLSTLLKTTDQFRPPAKIPFLGKVALSAAITCVETAEEVIDLHHCNLPENPALNGVLGAWWYTIMYAYTGATVLLAARMLLQSVDSSILGSNITRDSISKSWSKATAIIEFYSAHHGVAQKAFTALEVMWAKIPERFDIHHRQHQDENVQANTLDGHTNQQPQNELDKSADFIAMPNSTGNATMEEKDYFTNTYSTVDQTSQVPFAFSNNVTGPNDISQIGIYPSMMQQPTSASDLWMSNGLSDALFTNFDAWDPGDMSWLDSIPSQL